MRKVKIYVHNKILFFRVFVCVKVLCNVIYTVYFTLLFVFSVRDKDDGRGNNKVSSHWLAERATLTQLSELSQHVESLSRECETICPDASASYLRSAFKSQVILFS